MSTQDVDYLVIGGGPAGLQLGYYLQKHGCSYAILESSDRVGAFFAKLPRNRQLISFNKRFNIYDDPEVLLRWDWNSLLTDDYSFLFREYSKDLYPHADDMLRYLEGFRAAFDIDVRFETRVQEVTRRDSGFEVRDDSGTHWRCKVLVCATGFSREYVPDIPGIELAETYTNADISPESFEGKRVLIIGKGNSGFELADIALNHAAIIHLASPQPIRFAWNTRHAGHLRAHLTRILDAYQLKLLHGALDCHVRAIEADGDELVATVEYVHADDEVEMLAYDRVICAAGFQMSTDIFAEGARPNRVIDDRFPDLTESWESRNVPGLYFAGTLMQARDFQKASSAFVDGFRYNIRTLFHILRERYEDVPYPTDDLGSSPAEIAKAVQTRVTRTSGLWAQFNYLCDVLLVEDGEVRMQLERPLEEARRDHASHPHYYTVSFEWGPWEGDVFEIERHPRADMAYTNAFLHPVVRRWSEERLVEEHHILEDLLGVYQASGESGMVRNRSGRTMSQYHVEEHAKPLREFFARHLQPG